jgi:hypothetical protein
MSPQAKITITVLLLLFLGGLGAADYYLSSGGFPSFASKPPAVDSGSTVSVAPSAPIPGGGVAKQSGPGVEETIKTAGFTTTETSDLSFLAQIAGSGSEIHAVAILQNGDRTGSVTWIETPKVKSYFIALKEALLKVFTEKMEGLKDETMQGQNMPVRNVLTFLDTGLSSERLTFVRVRERLYEFHIAKGKEDTMNGLIETITTK